MPFCPRCGREVQLRDDFCSNCGMKLQRTAEVTRRRLYRSRRDRLLGGVCGGIANYFNIDPILVRVGWAFFSFAYGTGVILYIVLWLILPEEPL